MRAARYDLVVETGADLRRVFQLWKPSGVTADAASLAIGDRMYLDGDPLRVAWTKTAVGVDGRYWTDLVFGNGAWDAPRVRLEATEQVMPAVPEPVAEVSAGVTVLADKLPLPVALYDSGESVALLLTEADTIGMSPLAGSWSWDMYVKTAAAGWFRLVEGIFTVVRGDARVAL